MTARGDIPFTNFYATLPTLYSFTPSEVFVLNSGLPRAEDSFAYGLKIRVGGKFNVVHKNRSSNEGIESWTVVAPGGRSIHSCGGFGHFHRHRVQSGRPASSAAGAGFGDGRSRRRPSPDAHGG